MRKRVLILLLFTVFSITACYTQNFKLIDFTVAPCIDQDTLFGDQTLDFQYEVEENRLNLSIQYLTACCQEIKATLSTTSPDNELHISLQKQGEICDCYCLYPVKLEVEVSPSFEAELIKCFVNKVPVEIIPTGP